MFSQDKRNCFTFIWTLENVSFNWRSTHQAIVSPTFVINELQESKYRLELYLCGRDDDNYIDFHLQGENRRRIVRVDCEIALLSKDGSELKSLKREQCEDFADFCQFKEIKEVFYANRSTYLPDDKLRVRCRIWSSDEEMTENIQCFARTRINIQMQSFLWEIPNFSSTQSEEKCTYHIKSVPDNEVLVLLNLFTKNPYTDEDSLNIQFVAKSWKVKYIIFQLMPLKGISFANKSTRKEFSFCGEEKQKLLTLPFSKNDLIANKNLCMPFGVLNFRCECTFSTGATFEEIEKVIYGSENATTSEAEKFSADEENTLTVSKRILNESFKSLFHDNILSDIKLNTSCKTYFAHKSILSARSPVFRAMFATNMKENFSERVDIDDLDSDAVFRLLHYVYTAEVQDLQWESACELYRAADKYQILTLRDECSACLKSKLCRANACDILIFADTYQDNSLKTFVQDFIFDHDVINSDEFTQLMETHLKLAANIMRLHFQRKQTGNKLSTSTLGFEGNIAATLSDSSAFGFSQCSSSQFPMLTNATEPVTITPFQFTNCPVFENNWFSAPRKIRKSLRRVPKKE